MLDQLDRGVDITQGFRQVTLSFRDPRKIAQNHARGRIAGTALLADERQYAFEYGCGFAKFSSRHSAKRLLDERQSLTRRSGQISRDVVELLRRYIKRLTAPDRVGLYEPAGLINCRDRAFIE